MEILYLYCCTSTVGLDYLILLQPPGKCLAVPRAGDLVVGRRSPMSKQLELDVLSVELMERLALEQESLQALLLAERLQLEGQLDALARDVLAARRFSFVPFGLLLLAICDIQYIVCKLD